MSTLYIVVGIIILVIIAVIGVYNSLIAKRNRVKEAWSDIEVQLKRRYNLIPNVVEAVKGYVKHEKEVLENVTKARTQAMGAKDPKAHAEAENFLSDTLKTLFAVAENYPKLQANVNFLELQRELADTENKIQASRRFYNANVRDLNISIESFPQNIIASSFNFKREDFFEVEAPEERKNIKVKF